MQIVQCIFGSVPRARSGQKETNKCLMVLWKQARDPERGVYLVLRELEEGFIYLLNVNPEF